MTQDYRFLRKYNDVYIVERFSPRSGVWKDMAVTVSHNGASNKLTEFLKKDARKHKNVEFYTYRIKILKQTG